MVHPGKREQRTLELLSSLSYRVGELDRYLKDIACGVSQLIGLDWSVVTLLCKPDRDRILASNLELNDPDAIYSLHGTLTSTVVSSGRSLVVEDAIACPNYGSAPEGYRAYLGVPLRLPTGKTIGTICSFHRRSRHFSPEEVRIAELFAERAATAIDNYQLYQQQLQFNHILEAEVEKRTEELRLAHIQLVERERLAAIGEFAAIIVHEIRNPLATIDLGLSHFQRLQLPDSSQARLALALDELDRLKRLLGEILLYAKPQALQWVEVELNELSREIIDGNEVRSIEFSSTHPVANVLGDRDKLKQVFLNLFRNACEASPSEETIRWEIDRQTHCIWIRIGNNGDPIPPDIIPKLTQPFFSTKPEGTGLGLAIVKRIVEAHGGELSITSCLETGTTVSVCLPIEMESSKFSD
ncbi:MAG TPA: GAF domain-containing protein [Oscillatoriales cyanobacterium M59_W2019_021]|nr:GAF domain-containing protein [Oscillatoriales cyanobacterium M59_W2019_021]